jgi:hypothetical protein
MDLGSIFLILAVALFVAFFVAQPFLAGRPKSARRAAPDGANAAAGRLGAKQGQSALLAERDRVLDALQELDFDFALGKVPAEIYPVQRAALLQQGAAVLRQLEVGRSSQPALQTSADRLEPAAMERPAAMEQPALTDQVAPSTPAATTGNGNGHHGGAHPDDELETLLASRRRARHEKTAGFCPQCGKPVQKSDRFCHQCGKAVNR